MSFLGEDADSKDFTSHLNEAKNTDLSELERSGCVSQGRDMKGNHLIIMIPSLGLNKTEKPEVMFRKMLLLFIRKSNEIVGNPYSIVYAHTNIDIINQYPLIYKFYSILPRTYKKNLQKMFIIHPNAGIKMFFEFARVFLSHKFYAKLCLVNTIFEFQKMIPPTQLSLPQKFLRKEDEDRGLKYCGVMASLRDSFDPHIGTTRLIDICATYIKIHGGLLQPGIFRLSGDEGEMNLAKIRLQYSNTSGNYSDRVVLSENKDYILIGDIDGIVQSKNSTVISTPSEIKRMSSEYVDNNHSPLPEEVPTSILNLNNINTIANVLKMSIRDLPEPLISCDCYRGLIELTRRHEKKGLKDEWNTHVAHLLAQLPHEHLSTLVYLVTFIREVASHSDVNLMDAHNLAIVFTPTVCKSDTNDHMKALMEIKLSQIVVEEIIKRRIILDTAIRSFKQSEEAKGNALMTHIINENPVWKAALLTNEELKLHKVNSDLEKMSVEEEITSTIISSGILDRFSKGRSRSDRNVDLDNLSHKIQQEIEDEDKRDSETFSEEFHDAVTSEQVNIESKDIEGSSKNDESKPLSPTDIQIDVKTPYSGKSSYDNKESNNLKLYLPSEVENIEATKDLLGI